MILSIMQPAYLPWLGYYDRLMKSDIHVVLDHVQMEKGGFTNRNRIRTNSGSAWLTVPVKKTSSLQDMRIDQIVCNNSANWARKHMSGLQTWYGKAPFFRDYKDAFAAVYDTKQEYLVDVIDAFGKILISALAIDMPVYRSSKMGLSATKSALILEICLDVGADRYLSGPFGRDYLDIRAFDEAGVEVLWHNYRHPQYKQGFKGFEPYMSTVDLLFNHGPNARAIILQGSDLPPKSGPF